MSYKALKSRAKRYTSFKNSRKHHRQVIRYTKKLAIAEGASEIQGGFLPKMEGALPRRLTRTHMKHCFDFSKFFIPFTLDVVLGEKMSIRKCPPNQCLDYISWRFSHFLAQIWLLANVYAIIHKNSQPPLALSKMFEDVNFESLQSNM